MVETHMQEIPMTPITGTDIYLHFHHRQIVTGHIQILMTAEFPLHQETLTTETEIHMQGHLLNTMEGENPQGKSDFVMAVYFFLTS